MGNQEPRKVSKSSPVLQALLLADHVYTDESGKRIICGTFSKIFGRAFPGFTSFYPFVFVLLVDVVDEVILQLRLVTLDDNQIIMESGRLKIRSDDPLTPLDIAVQMPQLPLPRIGFYSLECWADDNMIGSVRLQVLESSAQEESNG